MVRVGNVPLTNALSSNASRGSRDTQESAYAIDRNFRLKTSGELWQFSGPRPNRKTDDRSEPPPQSSSRFVLTNGAGVRRFARRAARGEREGCSRRDL